MLDLLVAEQGGTRLSTNEFPGCSGRRAPILPEHIDQLPKANQCIPGIAVDVEDVELIGEELENSRKEGRGMVRLERIQDRFVVHLQPEAEDALRKIDADA